MPTGGAYNGRYATSLQPSAQIHDFFFYKNTEVEGSLEMFLNFSDFKMFLRCSYFLFSNCYFSKLSGNEKGGTCEKIEEVLLAHPFTGDV